MNEPMIKILQPGDEAMLERFLLPRVDASMFLISNIRTAGLLDEGGRYQGTYAAAFDGDQIIGVVAHSWNQNLIFQAPIHAESLWRAAVDASQRPVKGVIGPGDQVNSIINSMPIEDANIQMDESEGLYNLALGDLIVPEALRYGKVTGRRIEHHDLEIVFEWRVAYSIEALGENDTPQLHDRYRAAIERSLREKTTWVLEKEGKLVACSSFNSVIDEAVQVGGVWTPPEFRRRRYARCVVATSLLDAESQGVGKAILFTGNYNIPAQKAYLAIGFILIGDYRLTLFRSPLKI